jgi:membrane-anchored protein YejM (alkaline phosphatase superfamily)
MMHKSVRAASIPAAVLIIGFIFSSRCSPPLSDTNVILMTLDTMRADHLSYLNPGRSDTPNLDSLAANGFTFQNAFSPIPVTLPAHAALFYSRSPHELKVYNNGQIFHPDPDWMSLAEIFQKKGFQTAAFVSLGVLNSRFGLNRGFEDYVDTSHPNRWYLTAGEINQRVFQWIDDHSGKPFFLWIHYSDPHDPYAPPSKSRDLEFIINDKILSRISVRYQETLSMDIPLQPGQNILEIIGLNPFPSSRDEFRYSLNDFSIRPESLDVIVRKGSLLSRAEGNILAVQDTALLEIRNPGSLPSCRLETLGNINFFPSEMKKGYRREVEYMDQKIGELLNHLRQSGLMDKTLMAVAGDHGEGLGDYLEHRQEYYFGHIHYLKSIYTRVPLIINDPEKKNHGSLIDYPVTLLDIAPALLSRMGWHREKFHQGQNLFKPDSKNQIIFQETYAPEADADRFAGIRFPWQLIFIPESSDFKLYRLDHGKEPRADQYSHRRETGHVKELTLRVVEKSLQILKNKKDVPLDPDSLEMLKSLGYIR